MSEKEQFEFAAKAAGLEYFDYIEGMGMREQAVHGAPHCGYQGSIWNPRDNDGDAFRLAVKLGVKIHPVGPNQVNAAVECEAGIYYNEIKSDPCTAIRQLIFFVAVEQGRAME